jgi:hypothetical protein
MHGRVALTWFWIGVALLSAQGDPDEILARITAKVQEDLRRLPDYVCHQTIERSQRLASMNTFRSLDVLRLEVALVGNREMYSWRGAEKFEEKELADLVDRGVVGTGGFALLARHVFLTRGAGFTYRGEERLGERRTVRFDYEVALEHSSFRIRAPKREAVVGFEGSIWADAETLDLIRLEVRALDIPERVGVAQADSVMSYVRVPMGDASALLPQSADLKTITVGGDESRNNSRFTDCRRYQAESILSFGEPPPARPAAAPRGPSQVPVSALLELSLAEDIELESAKQGDAIQAVLARPLRDGDRVIAPEGTRVSGSLLRLDHQTLPFEHYIVAMQLDAIELEGARVNLAATLEDVSPATGLIRQAKKLNPTFTPKQRGPRMEILVGEQHAGQGVVHWDARHPRIRKGLKMRWQTIASR